jgi:hypothetical protein
MGGSRDDAEACHCLLLEPVAFPSEPVVACQSPSQLQLAPGATRAQSLSECGLPDAFLRQPSPPWLRRLSLPLPLPLAPPPLRPLFTCPRLSAGPTPCRHRPPTTNSSSASDVPIGGRSAWVAPRRSDSQIPSRGPLRVRFPPWPPTTSLSQPSNASPQPTESKHNRAGPWRRRHVWGRLPPPVWVDAPPPSPSTSSCSGLASLAPPEATRRAALVPSCRRRIDTTSPARSVLGLIRLATDIWIGDRPKGPGPPEVEAPWLGPHAGELDSGIRMRFPRLSSESGMYSS